MELEPRDQAKSRYRPEQKSGKCNISKMVARAGVPLRSARTSPREGRVIVTAHREGRKAEVPLSSSREILDPRVVRRACEELGLDPSQLPGPEESCLR